MGEYRNEIVTYATFLTTESHPSTNPGRPLVLTVPPGPLGLERPVGGSTRGACGGTEVPTVGRGSRGGAGFPR